jgi:2-polyprenyl-3-methyl-5-hydroxy-6-metoxy-1,4-benzoquinol methylase
MAHQDRDEIEFDKYNRHGAYHWDQISIHPVKSNSFVKGRYIKCIELLKDKCDMKNKKILDLGCGDGALSYLLWKKGSIVYGIDNSEIAIKYAKKKHTEFNTNCQFLLADCYKTEFDSNYFDCVVCTDVMEHILEPLKLLTETKRVLKPEGYAVISTPIRFTYKPLDKMHMLEWFQEEFEDMVSQVFHGNEFYESHPLFWMEFMNRSLRNRIIVNLLSLFSNPFISNSNKWRYNALQYIVVKK